MDLQILIVLLAVGASIAYLVRRATRAAKTGGGCGCSACGEGCPAEKQRQCQDENGGI